MAGTSSKLSTTPSSVISSKKLMIPERYSSLMNQTRRTSLAEIKSRAVSTCSATSTASSTISEFLENRVKICQLQMEYFASYQDGMKEALQKKEVSEYDYHEEVGQLDEQYEPIVQELKVLGRQRKFLEEDMEEGYGIQVKRLKTEKANDAGAELIERAYASALVSKVMTATAKQKKQKFDQSKFRKDVLEYYGAARQTGAQREAYCHLTGWWLADDIKAAHLVPKSLSGDELSFLFGVREAVLSDSKNGISLQRKIEEGLDSGIIAIVPVPPLKEDDPTKWKCVLVDRDMRDAMFSRSGRDVYTWKELDGKELVFLSDNRPARRFLYFRFVVTYLHAKKSGNTAWAERIDSRNVLWASPGPYLEKSTLLSLGRNISGFELPPPLYEDMTFDSAEPPKDATQEVVLSMRVREALIESVKRRESDESGEESLSDDEGSEECEAREA
ncbi:hypothetical protein FQN55_000013 [Onygenales sp. PD_40]|nr:hypothetical protein FQN55_000013 [Onygenales sp. PD_40]KAK2789048.1 hypothetical protein FQN52_006415 [Onygenales sp. PD_12]